MKLQIRLRWPVKFILWMIILAFFAATVISPASDLLTSAAELNLPIRRVNIPYASVKPPENHPTQPAIFWFGKVDPTNNYVDVRTIYDDENLRVTIHVFDRLLWYEPKPSKEELTDWDAATLYLNLDGQVGDAPGARAHRFVAQLNDWQTREEKYQAAYQGNGLTWELAPTTFTTVTSWQGSGFNKYQSNRGWRVSYSIPFKSLGLSQPPPKGTTWGMAVVVHDRDDASGTPIPDKVWPEWMSANAPSTWGQAVFGPHEYVPPPNFPVASATIRHGLNGTSVLDGHVGGNSTCGKDYQPNFFGNWGEANYAGSRFFNVQNQWDVADWPCFSKYFVTFPLDSLPAGKIVHSASLKMYQFGSSWGDGVQDSWIQVLTVSEDWDEAKLTWNNAPLAQENLSGTWVEPLDYLPSSPGIPHQWDVSLAVAQAYAAGEPLRLALYSADYAYHSGRYFHSSDTGDWNAAGRPALTVILGVPPESEDYSFVFLPLLLR